MIKPPKEYFFLQEQKLQSGDTILLRCSGMNKKDNTDKVQKVVYMPKHLADFIQTHSEGPMTSCCVSLIEYAIKEILKKKTTIKALS